jgi:hypothetical protein
LIVDSDDSDDGISAPWSSLASASPNEMDTGVLYLGHLFLYIDVLRCNLAAHLGTSNASNSEGPHEDARGSDGFLLDIDVQAVPDTIAKISQKGWSRDVEYFFTPVYKAHGKQYRDCKACSYVLSFSSNSLFFDRKGQEMIS